MKAMKGLLVVNEGSGSGSANLQPVIDALAAAEINVERLSPDSPTKIPDIIRREASSSDIVVVGGGDGTFNGAAPALLEAGRPVGFLPMGTANDLARTLGIPFDLESAAAVIAKDARRRIDLGLVNERPFFNVASIGFSSEVAKFHSGERKKRLGLLSYPLSWIDAYRRHRPFEAELICDGQKTTLRCSQLAIGNGRYYGGGMTISAEASIDDGWLRAYCIETIDAGKMARLFMALRRGALAQHSEIRTLRGKEIEVITRRPQRINVDGELIGETPAKFKVLPNALEVFVPETIPRNPNGQEEGSDMEVLRDDALVALNGVVTACHEAAKLHRQVGEILEDSRAAKALSRLADRREADCEQLGKAMQQRGDIPHPPPEELQLIEEALTHAKALLSDKGPQALLMDCAAKEEAVAAAAAAAIEMAGDEALIQKLADLRDDASGYRDRLGRGDTD